MKRIIALFITHCLILLITSNTYSLEALSDISMSNISGQATGFSEDTGPSVYNNYSTNVSSSSLETDDQRRYAFPGEYNGTHKTILLDFIGKDTVDDFGNTYRAPFSTEMHVGDIAYENKDSGAFAIFDGYANGFIQIPETYGLNKDGELMFSKTVNVSNASIPENISGTNFICSYQGNIFTPESLNALSEEGTTFEIYPNRQAQTIGEAIGGDLTILIPVEKEDGTFEWGVGTVVPDGMRYIHIDLNRMDESRTILYDTKFANNLKGINEPTLPPETLTGKPPTTGLRSNTLGTVYVDSTMSVLGGSVFITIEN